MTTHAQVESDAGSVSIELAFGIGLLLFPVLMMIVMFPIWSERQNVARTAAEEAARSVVLAPTYASGTDRGRTIAYRIAENHGLSGEIESVSFEGSINRGASVKASVGVRIPIVSLFGVEFGGVTWNVDHTELVDLYKSRSE